MSTGRLGAGDTAIQPTIFDAKADILTATAADTPARLAVGNNGETLVADSSTSTGLRYQPAKTTNHIINGGFDFWQRATSSTFTPTNGSPQYNSVDRFWFTAYGTTGSMTVSRQTADTVSLQYGLRFGRASGATATGQPHFGTNIESQQMKLLAGKTVVVSFYAKKGADFSFTPTAALYTGTGTDQAPVTLFNGAWTGGADVFRTNFSPTTTMTRYTFTATVPTTSNELAFFIYWSPSGTAGANEWLQIEGVQLEVGSVATEFQRSGGTLAGELAACQRYYFRQTATAAYSNLTGFGYEQGATTAQYSFFPPVTMRVKPSSVDYSAIKVSDYNSSFAITAFALDGNNTDGSYFLVSATIASGGTAGRPCVIQANNNSAAYIGFSAEL